MFTLAPQANTILTIHLIYYTDLTPLGNLSYLLSLDVSHNKLTTLLDFKPPFGLRVSIDANICCAMISVKLEGGGGKQGRE